jgi:hypothetical protein
MVCASASHSANRLFSLDLGRLRGENVFVGWIAKMMLGLSRIVVIRWLPLLFAIGMGSLPISSGWSEEIGSSGTPKEKQVPVEQEQQEREIVNQEFLRKRSDPSGHIRPDLWRKGMEHSSRMLVAPSIGARPTHPPSNN